MSAERQVQRMSTTTTAQKRGPYAKTARTRQRAIEAAIEISSASGYHGATLTDVADRLGMTLTGLQHHFPDKESLLAAVLEERDKRSQAEISVELGEDATEKLLSIVERNDESPGQRWGRRVDNANTSVAGVTVKGEQNLNPVAEVNIGWRQPSDRSVWLW